MLFKAILLSIRLLSLPFCAKLVGVSVLAPVLALCEKNPKLSTAQSFCCLILFFHFQPKNWKHDGEVCVPLITQLLQERFCSLHWNRVVPGILKSEAQCRFLWASDLSAVFTLLCLKKETEKKRKKLI